jgi:hypothetical protein
MGAMTVAVRAGAPPTVLAVASDVKVRVRGLGGIVIGGCRGGRGGGGGGPTVS